MEIKHLLCRPKLSFAGCFQSLKVEKKNVIKDIRIHVEMGGKIQTVVGCFQSLKVEKKNVIKDIRIHVRDGRENPDCCGEVAVIIWRGDHHCGSLTI